MPRHWCWRLGVARHDAAPLLCCLVTPKRCTGCLGGVKEDPFADLRQKRRKRKVSEASAEDVALGVDSVWEHEVNPIDQAFPADYNFYAYAWI
ncbi:hypothetical protein PIB30_095601 [Stylosanthes scabra]|uniref:Uncharacterized protein n=1 Tax=Stylosanthes scabra TaxID=79078 RepID=A0ABU6ZUE1_9FABA|nr:hypothetical protein [Stylosanthes scabra]